MALSTEATSRPQLDVQQFHIHQGDGDVPGDDDALVEHPLQDIGQAGGLDSVLHTWFLHNVLLIIQA